jgi:hypothetical protein
MADSNPLVAATRLVLQAQETEAVEERQPSFDLLGLPEIEKNANLSRAGRGRPPGARNRTTREWCEYIAGKYGSPLEVLAQMARVPTEQLAIELRCSRLDAYVQKRHAAESLAPYLHPKLSTVEFYPPGHPAGPASPLTLLTQDWQEISDAVVADVAEPSEPAEAATAGENEPEAVVNADADNVEGEVADTIVEQALDAVVLLARDPRYADLVRRRLKDLK